jgi:hypothetical protein
MRHHFCARWVLVSGITSALTVLSPFQQFVHAGTTPASKKKAVVASAMTLQSNVSYACVSLYSVRIVPASEACRPGERRMVISGVSGSTGPQGPEGPEGPEGPAGPAGPAGSAGPKGDAGSQGVAGAKGETGDKGDAGPQGSAGTTGQMVMTAVSNGHRFLSVFDGGPYEVPGLSGSIVTTENSSVVVSTEGVIEHTDDSVVGDNIKVGIRLKIDDVVLAVRYYNIELTKFTKMTHWSFSSSTETLTTPLTPGKHTVSVDAMWLGFNNVTPSFPSASVAGAGGTWGQSSVTAIVVNK